MSLKITYWTASRLNPNVPGAVISSEVLAISATSAQSGTTPSNAVFTSITSTETATFEYSSANPTASITTSAWIGAGERLWQDAAAGYKVAGIQAT